MEYSLLSLTLPVTGAEQEEEICWGGLGIVGIMELFYSTLSSMKGRKGKENSYWHLIYIDKTPKEF